MILAGDWAPGRKVGEWRARGALVLANLEGPILPIDHELPPAAKAGPSLFSSHLPRDTDRFVFTLANNHLMDYGLAGLDATLAALEPLGYQACGAGGDVAEARRPLVVDDGGVRIGIVACCEAQFGVATRRSAGVADLGPWTYEAIRQLRDVADAVVVTVHAAVEDSPWPSPYVRDLYRSFVDTGAAVVHGHHAHVPQGFETYGAGVIFYGTGNYAVDPDVWRDAHEAMWSLTPEIDVSVSPPRWRLVTSEIRATPGAGTFVVDSSAREEFEAHSRYLEACNQPLRDVDLFEALWQEVAIRAYQHYGATYMRFDTPPPRGRREWITTGASMIKDAVLARVPPPVSPGRSDYLLWHHMLTCESHRQMLATALGVLGGEIADRRTDETRSLADAMMPWSRAAGPA